MQLYLAALPAFVSATACYTQVMFPHLQSIKKQYATNNKGRINKPYSGLLMRPLYQAQY